MAKGGKKAKGNSYKQNKGRRDGAVQPKKHLGQHFLKDEEIAKQISDTISLNGYKKVIEIGPGTGVLTKYLLARKIDLTVIDLDRQSVAFLEHDFKMEQALLLQSNPEFTIIEGDFLKLDVHELVGSDQFAIIGNYPYNISTQIVFRMLEYKTQVPEFSGMFQKEVAQRICAKEGSKTYGILSVLVQAFYTANYLFTVPPTVFDPPPKVESGVLQLIRKEQLELPCDEKLFFRVVKTAFNQRRKTLRNSLKAFKLSDNLKEDAIFGQRPEQLAVDQFVWLTQKIENDAV